MAIFRKKSDDSSPKDELKAFAADPAKAQKWFQHAKSMADSHQYASALVYYANGLKFDPDSISAQEAMLAVGQQHLKNGGKKISSKDIKQLDGPYPSDKLAMAMLPTGEPQTAPRSRHSRRPSPVRSTASPAICARSSSR